MIEFENYEVYKICFMLSFGGVVKKANSQILFFRFLPPIPTLSLSSCWRCWLLTTESCTFTWEQAQPGGTNCLPQGWEPSQEKPASNDWLTLESNDQGFCRNSGQLNASPASELPVGLTEVVVHCIAVQHLLPNPLSLTSSSVVP